MYIRRLDIRLYQKAMCVCTYYYKGDLILSFVIMCWCKYCIMSQCVTHWYNFMYRCIKVRVNIKQWGTINFCYTSQGAGFPTSVGCFHEIATNCLNTLTQLAKEVFLFT